ncbi:MAG: PQQ-binding-like beta-propeller repeat protein [Gemmataceae bacterium]
MSATPEHQTPSDQIAGDGPPSPSTQIQPDSPSPAYQSGGSVSDVPNSVQPLKHPVRLWPALLISFVGVMTFVFSYFVIDRLDVTREWSNSFFVLLTASAMPALCTLLTLIWWLFFSRQTWSTKVKVLALLAIATTGVIFACEPGIRFVIIMWGLPAAVAAMVFHWALPGSPASWSRTLGLIGVMVVSLLPWIGLKFDGSAGNALPDLTLRWSEGGRVVQNPEGMADLADRQLALHWPGFRGPKRDGIVEGVKISVDFVKNPPEPIWKTAVGDGWSSCVIVGDLLYTQEQRHTSEEQQDNKYECVVCYDANTKKALWIHKEETLFFETQGQGGPRATPTYENGNLYVMGATGRFLCLDALTGDKKWGVDITKSNGSPAPTWGFSASPLIYKNLVLVQGGGFKGQPILLAYDKKTGDLKWAKGKGVTHYCSPVLMKLDGVEQIVQQSGSGITSHDPETGDVLWEIEWEAPVPSSAVALPWQIGPQSMVAVLGHPEVGGTSGAKRFKITESDGQWNVEEVWHSKRFDPRFNDIICHDGYLYGLSAGTLECYDLKTGSRQWRGDRYGFGQLLLVGDKLLVISEKRVGFTKKGFVVLVKADPEKFTPLGQFPAVEGKAWNHPAIANGKLYVRTEKEMVCYPVTSVDKNDEVKKD